MKRGPITMRKGPFEVEIRKRADRFAASWIGGSEQCPATRIKTFVHFREAQIFSKGLLEGMESRNMFRRYYSQEKECVKDSPTVVYAVRFGNLVKIGITKNLLKRMAAFTHANQSPAKVLCSLVAGCREEAESIERKLHITFRAQRVGGEWFNLDDQSVLAQFNHFENHDLEGLPL